MDLEPVLLLQRRYLRKLGVNQVSFATADELDSARDYDLVISNYAFSECTRPVQQRYIKQILARSVRGYIICNWFLGRLVPMTPAELLAAVPGASYEDGDPGASILVWGTGRGEISDSREEPVDLKESAGSRVGKAGLAPE